MEYKKGGTEIGKQLADKSKGLFSADDWQCKTLVFKYFKVYRDVIFSSFTFKTSAYAT